jgi:hypothetical protein
LDLYEALAQRQLDARLSALTAAFGDIYHRERSPTMWRSVLDAAEFVLEPYAGNSRGAEARSARELMALLQRFSDDPPMRQTSADSQTIDVAQAANVVELPAKPGATKLTLVPGQDVVSLQFVDGPTLVLHPETARTLMQAVTEDATPTGGRAAEGRAVSGKDGRPRGLLGGALLKAVDVLHGVAESGDAVQRALEQVDGTGPRGLQALGRKRVLDLGGAALVRGPASPEPWLVLIPGPMLDAETTFGALWQEHPGMVARLLDRFSGRAFAFAHRSLTNTPIINAIELAEACPHGTQLVLLTHGGGGLIAEALVRAAAAPMVGAVEMPDPWRLPALRLVKLMHQRRHRACGLPVARYGAGVQTTGRLPVAVRLRTAAGRQDGAASDDGVASGRRPPSA